MSYTNIPVGRPHRMQSSFIGIAALSHLGNGANGGGDGDGGGSGQSIISYAQLDAPDDSRSSSNSSSRKQVRRTRTGRVALSSESEVRAEIEEQNRIKASKFVAADKWEEATTSVWFPVGRRKAAWDVLVLFVLLYSIASSPFASAST